MAGQDIDMDGITDPACLEIKGIPHSAALLRFSNAFMTGDDAELAEARELLAAKMGAAAMIDAAGVASNFQRMVRIADGTGIPLESMGEETDSLVSELNKKHGIDKYVSAANSAKNYSIYFLCKLTFNSLIVSVFS